jgi:peptidoglycan/xylan/chitin deacetylase (PgdA/CDA1 family)
LASRWKVATKSALCALFKYSGGATLQEAYLRSTGQASMVILLFHRVTDAIPDDHALTVSPRRFRAICRMLRARFRVVPLAEIFRIVRSGQPFPLRSLAVTFDDSYGDNLEAARILAEYRLPATFFIPAAYVGTEQVYDWDRNLPVRLPNLSWDEVREISALGFDIGSHSLTHADMARLDDDQARHELVESRKILENQLGRPVRWFAYPFGEPENFRPEQMTLVREAGYEGCVSAHHGFIYRGQDYPILPREPVPYFESVLNLELYLRGCLGWFYSTKRRLRSHTTH